MCGPTPAVRADGAARAPVGELAAGEVVLRPGTAGGGHRATLAATMADTARRRSAALPKRKVAELRALLEAEAEELRDQVRRLEADFADESWREPRSDDDAESGSATFERERTMSLARNARGVLTQVEAALARVDDGTYGRCTSCGNPIAVERLDALPQAADCMDCRRAAERRNR